MNAHVGRLGGLWLVAPLLVACGSSTPAAGADGGGAAPTDAGNPATLAPGTGILSGNDGFPVKWAWMHAYAAAANCESSDASAPAGGIDAIAIQLFENDESSPACSDAGLSGAAGHFVDLEIATSSYLTGAAPFVALAPGTYTIGNEGENDPDLCMLSSSGGNAYLAVGELGVPDAQNLAASGTVTIDSIDAGGVVGSFQVVLGDAYGRTDAGLSTLAGSFHAETCP